MKKISSMLRQTREDKGLTLEDVERATKIKKTYLISIEEGKFYDLPSESYALGFVKNYAKFLDYPLATAVPLFRREYSERHNVHNIVPNFRRTQYKFNKRFFMNSKALLILVSFLIIIIYIFFQYSSLIFPPELSISSPISNSQIPGNVVEVSGKTDPYATVTINGEEVYVNLQGTFKKSIYMFSGNGKIQIKAKNRYGKETAKEINVRVK